MKHETGDAGDTPRAQQLYDEGARILASRWDGDIGLVCYETPGGVFHGCRESLAYASVLLREGSRESIERAERIIATVASMQETREDDAHYGNFRWFFEDAGVTDLNAVEFALDHLNALVREHAATLSDVATVSVRAMIALGLREIDRLDVHPSYTNIALSDICNSILGGETLGDAAFVDRGRRRLDEWFAFTNGSGAPHEFNSPTYAAVDIARMAMLGEWTRDPGIALKARLAEERLWLHAATHYHPALAQIPGPHSRSYRDGWTGAGGYTKLLLWRLLGDDNLRRATPYYAAGPPGRTPAPGGREEGHTGIALDCYHCPPEALAWLREKNYPFEALETADAAGGLDLSTYMTASYALGTASRSYGVGEPPEAWPQSNSLHLYFARDADPGYGALFCRYIVNDKHADLWDDGQHVGAQHRNRAIIAYGLRARARPAHSYKLSVRILGVAEGSEIWCGDRQIDAFPATIDAGEPIVVAEGGVYAAIIPLEPSDMGSGATIELNVAAGVLTLEIYNYRGPAKTFWEHRSQSGPFYKGNVRNAFVLEVAERDEYAGLGAFRRHIASARITDSVDEDYVREIAYASDGGAIAMRYSLWDMRLIERRYDGAVYAPPMGRAGAIAGGGMQWTQSRDSMIELAGVKLMAGRTPKWLAADPDAGRYAFVNPSDEAAPLWLETPQTTIECDEFGFGRVALDEAAQTITVEAIGEIGALRVRGDGSLRVSVNGADVTDVMTARDADGVRVFGG